MWNDPLASPVSARRLLRLNQKNVLSDHWLRQEVAHSRRSMEHNIRKLHQETRHILDDAMPSVRSRSYSPHRRDLAATSTLHKRGRDILGAHASEVTNRLSQTQTPRLPELGRGSGQRLSRTPGSLSNSSKLNVSYSTPRSSPNTSTLPLSPPTSRLCQRSSRTPGSLGSWSNYSEHTVLYSSPRSSSNASTLPLSPPNSRPSLNPLKPATLYSPPKTSPTKRSKVVVLPSPPWSSPKSLSDSSTMSGQNSPRSSSNRSKPAKLSSDSKSPSNWSKLTALHSLSGSLANRPTLTSSQTAPWSVSSSSNLAPLPSIPRSSSHSKTSPKPSTSPLSQTSIAQRLSQGRPSHLVIPNVPPKNVAKKPVPEPHTRRLSRKLEPISKLQTESGSLTEGNSKNYPALETFATRKPILKSREKSSISKRAKRIPRILITEASELSDSTIGQSETGEEMNYDCPETAHILSQMDDDVEPSPYIQNKRCRSHSEPALSSFAPPLPLKTPAEGQTGAEAALTRGHAGTEEAEPVPVCQRARSSSVSVPYFSHLKNSLRRESLLKKYTAQPGLSKGTTQRIHRLISENVKDGSFETVTDKEWEDLRKCRYLRMPRYEGDNVRENSLDLDEIFSHNAD